MASIAVLVGDDFLCRYLMEFLRIVDLEALGLTCVYLQAKVTGVLRVQVRRQYPRVLTRQPVFRLRNTSHRHKRRLQQSLQRRLDSFLQRSASPLFHGLAGRLGGTGYLFHDDGGEWIFNPHTDMFDIDWVDSISSVGDYASDDESSDGVSPRRYAAMPEDPIDAIPMGSDDTNDHPAYFTREALSARAEASVVNWQHLADALSIHATLLQLCIEFETHCTDDSLVVQGAFPFILYAPSLADGWTASDLHAVLLPHLVASPAFAAPHGLALNHSDCIFSDCAFIDWDHIDEDMCHACAQQESEVWPPREVMFQWLLPQEELEPTTDLSGGPNWRRGIACAGVTGDDRHWDEYVGCGDGNFVCLLCVREGYVRDPREYSVCTSFVQPLKAAMRASLDCVRMETYIDNSAIHLFGGVTRTGYFCGVVCYEVATELVDRVGIY
ncbi:hypothetical protein ACHHYP_16606 [Achlya hypogyna]|uniref:Uncharacterized protein n=1 Tax=Achlya hypogyna TaxID=1202772 RepID=A0A1V9Y6A9_ACHHY|nr:hypothetical protein ACHHYP_16606 [Achlya hypogyna]